MTVEQAAAGVIDAVERHDRAAASVTDGPLLLLRRALAVVAECDSTLIVTLAAGALAARESPVTAPRW